MYVTTIQEAVQQLKQSIFLRVRHRTLLRYTGAPTVDESQLFFLLLPYLNGETWHDDLQERATVVGIVQASLFEHDKIQEKQHITKKQQLTVLSGDYYSGRYYQILAAVGNIELTQQLAQGIIARCEQEIAAYEHTYKTMNQWVESICIIETAIIHSFYNAHQFSKYAEVMCSALTTRRLQRELKTLEKGSRSVPLQAMEVCFGPQLKHHLQEAIIKQRQQFMRALHTLNLPQHLHEALLSQIEVETE